MKDAKISILSKKHCSADEQTPKENLSFRSIAKSILNILSRKLE